MKPRFFIYSFTKVVGVHQLFDLLSQSSLDQGTLLEAKTLAEIMQRGGQIFRKLGCKGHALHGTH